MTLLLQKSSRIICKYSIFVFFLKNIYFNVGKRVVKDGKNMNDVCNQIALQLPLKKLKLKIAHYMYGLSK